MGVISPTLAVRDMKDRETAERAAKEYMSKMPAWSGDA